MKLSSESQAAPNARIAPKTMVAAARNADAPSTTRRLIVGSILPWPPFCCWSIEVSPLNGSVRIHLAAEARTRAAMGLVTASTTTWTP